MEKGKSNINIAPLDRSLPAKLLTEEKRSRLSFLTFDLLPAERQLLRGGKACGTRKSRIRSVGDPGLRAWSDRPKGGDF